MDRPLTRYATTDDDVHIAYQVIGDGPIDLVFVHAFVSHVELFWDLPTYARFVRELSSWARVIVFDKRGIGLSDRLSVTPTLEARIDDLRAVLDAVGSQRALVLGNSDGGALSALFAATYPERTLGLALWSGGVRCYVFIPQFSADPAEHRAKATRINKQGLATPITKAPIAFFP